MDQTEARDSKESADSQESRDLPLETRLLEALSQIEKFEQCALLDYPDHLNSGDQLIWLGTCFYLIETRKARITYTSCLVDFDQTALREKNGKAPIFLQGGGNLGDLWPDSQKFRELVVQNNHDCPIYILPQSIFFKDEGALHAAQKTFNAHPHLTIFARDQRSYELSCRYFPRARSILAPDMIFILAPVLQNFFKKSTPGKRKLLLRADQESCRLQIPDGLSYPGFVQEDWETYQWVYDGRGKLSQLPDIYKKLPGSVFAVRELWQRGLCRPGRLPQRLKWRYLKRFAPVLAAMPNRAQTLFSWMIAFDAACQIAECRLLLTDRLHAHLTACILGVDNGLLANAYHKNEQFFATWQRQRQSSRFLANAAEILDFASADKERA